MLVPFCNLFNCYLYTSKKNIQNIKLWYIPNILVNSIDILNTNFCILISIKDKFLSSNKEQVYLTKYPTKDSLWITVYNILDLSNHISIRALNQTRCLINIYGYYLKHEHTLFIQNNFNKDNVFISCITPYYRISKTISFNINFIFIKRIQLYYIYDFQKILFKEFNLLSSHEDSFLIALQDIHTKKYLNSNITVYYSNSINLNSLWVVSYDINTNYKNKSLINRYGYNLCIQNKDTIIDISKLTLKLSKDKRLDTLSLNDYPLEHYSHTIFIDTV